MISLTDAAVQKVRDLMTKENKTEYGLRVFIKGGGCAGFSYGLAFDTPRQDDQVIDANGVRVIVDPFSAMYLEGTEIDYVDGLMGAGFAINNPNAVTSCACGHSFNTTGAKPAPKGTNCC
ncbi:MAG TPA: iron-sulfur cluster insertion protein ErpA [Chloroflexota bacterium]|jgi:iron-sulfur cluster assembly protein